MAVKTYFYHYVTARIGADCPRVLQALRSNLYHLGCRDIAFTSTIEELRHWVQDSPPDLLIVQSDLGAPDDVYELFRAIRHGELGNNPFVPLVAVTHVAEPELIKSLVNAGIDDVLPYPWPDAYLDQRLNKLIHQRKPFVVTSDYIGPDRRGKTRPGDAFADVTPIQVPNPLRAKAMDRLSDEVLSKQVADSAAQVQADRVRRLAELAIRLAADLAILNDTGRTGSALAKTCLERLAATTSAILHRAQGTAYEAACTSCRTLNRTTTLMLKSLQQDMAPELHLLHPLADRFAQEFGIDTVRILAHQSPHGVQKVPEETDA